MTEQSPDAAAQAIRIEALRMAAEYHAKTAHAPTAKGSASAPAVTATAQQFVLFLQDAANRAGVQPGDLEPDSTSDR